jgi:Flp pilus assembly protein TadD
MGAVRLRLQLYQEAIAEYRRALASDSTDPDMLYGLALALLRSGARAEAESCAVAALRLRPGMQAAQTLLDRVRGVGAGPSS